MGKVESGIGYCEPRLELAEQLPCHFMGAVPMLVLRERRYIAGEFPHSDTFDRPLPGVRMATAGGPARGRASAGVSALHSGGPT